MRGPFLKKIPMRFHDDVRIEKEKGIFRGTMLLHQLEEKMRLVVVEMQRCFDRHEVQRAICRDVEQPADAIFPDVTPGPRRQLATIAGVEVSAKSPRVERVH